VPAPVQVQVLAPVQVQAMAPIQVQALALTWSVQALPSNHPSTG